MKPTLVGIHPRPEFLIAATRDYDRKRINREELARALNDARKKLFADQAKLGFSPKIDGLYDWQDLFRPLIKTLDGLSEGPLTRFFDNNTFYRKPVVKGKIAYRAGFRDYVRGEKLIVPGPYTFLTLSSNSFYKDELELMWDYVESIEKLAKDVGVKYLQLNEPSMVCNNPKDAHFDLVATAFRRLKGLGEVLVHTYFGDCSKAALELQSRGVDFIGIDLTETSPSKLSCKLLLGIVDSRNTFIESVDYVKGLLKMFDDVVYIAPNCDMEFLPYNEALKKMELLSKIADEVG